MAADCYDLAGTCDFQHLLSTSLPAEEDTTSPDDRNGERAHAGGFERALLIERAYSLESTLLISLQYAF